MAVAQNVKQITGRQGSKIEILEAGYSWVRLDWSGTAQIIINPVSPSSIGGKISTPRSDITGASSPREIKADPESQNFENFLELAYTPDQPDTDAFTQNEEGNLGELGVGEEVDRTQIYPERPAVFYTVQLLSQKFGWTTAYRGSGTTCEVKNLPSGSESHLRIKMTQNDGQESAWTSIMAQTKSREGSGRELIEAVRANSAPQVRDILKYARVEQIDAVVDEGHTPLVAAISSGAKDALGVLLEKKADPKVTTAGPFITPLMLAAWYGKTSQARRLKDAGASWNQKDWSGMTALHYAVAALCVDTTKAALEDGADPIVLAAGDSVFSFAVRSLASQTSENSSNLINSIENESEKEDALQIFDLLAQYGGNVNQKGRNGNTALHIAILSKVQNAVKKLLDLGASTTLENSNGFTAIHLALLTNIKDRRLDI